MSISRRTAIKAAAAAVPALCLPRALRAGKAGAGEPSALPIAAGAFTGTRESLRAWRAPEWYRDAKFGIWAHWGPQSAAEAGDWYARNMYMEGSRQYRHHVQTYGHPSKFGFKDVIPTWHARDFDPDHLVSLYKKAGAKYFVSMGVHHDNFDLWDSAHTRWNAVRMGPRRDVVGEFAKAARSQGLRFGVSDHLWISYKWFSTSHGADKDGPLAGVAYDGADPANADLYHDVKEVYTNLPWDEEGIPEGWKRHWFARIKDLVDKYRPDLLYCDGHIPFERYGLSILAHLYNTNPDALYTSKRREDSEVGTCLFDVERGLVDSIWPAPWQTDTCVGNWHYDRGARYKSAKTVIDMLVDIVSRNGNLLLNFPLPNSGALDEKELAILEGITAWMGVNSEGIYGTRPWKTFGAGPSTTKPSGGDAKFNEKNRKALAAEDIRFTTKGETLYAFSMGWAGGKQMAIPPLALGGAQGVGRVDRVELLGSADPLPFTQDTSGLTVTLPEVRPGDHAVCFKVQGHGLT